MPYIYASKTFKFRVCHSPSATLYSRNRFKNDFGKSKLKHCMYYNYTMAKRLDENINKEFLHFGASLKVPQKTYVDGEPGLVEKVEASLVGLMTWEGMKARPAMRFEYTALKTTRAFFDIDMKLSSVSEEDFRAIKDELFTVLKKNSTIQNFVYTDGSYWSADTAKVSTHVIFQRDYIDKKSFSVKSSTGQQFISKMLNGVSNMDTFTSYFDDGVYGKKHIFRLPNAKMVDKPTVHVPLANTMPHQYFVSLIPSEDVYISNRDDVAEDEEPKKKKSKKGKKEEKEDLEALIDTPLEVERLLGLVDCLHPKKRAYSREDWFRLACVLHNLLPYDIGLEKFISLSQRSGYEDFKEEECEKTFSNLKSDHPKPLGERTLVRWAREDNSFKAKEVLKDDERFQYDITFTSTNHKNRLEELIGWINLPRKKIVRDVHSKKVYIREENRWEEFTGSMPLSGYFTRLEFTIGGFQRNELKRVENDMHWMERMVWSQALSILPMEDIELKFYTSTLGKLCFPNGVWDFKEKKFSLWEKNEGVYTRIVAPWPYEEADEKEEMIAREQMSFFSDSTRDNHLRRISQMLAGLIHKYLNLAITGRDSGKSGATKMLRLLFGDYISTFCGNSLLQAGKEFSSSDAQTKLAWFNPLRYCRIAVSNELDVQGKYLNSVLVKMLTGGDEIVARGLYERHTTGYKHSCSLLVFANHLPQTNESDVWNHVFSFEFPHNFYSETDKKEKMEKEMWDDKIMKVAKETFAEDVVKQHRKGLTSIILKAFSETRCETIQLNSDGDAQDEDDNPSLVDAIFNGSITKHFVETNDEKDCVHNTHYQDFLEKHEQFEKKTKKELISKLRLKGKESKTISITCNGKDSKVRGFRGLKYVDDCPYCKPGNENLPK